MKATVKFEFDNESSLAEFCKKIDAKAETPKDKSECEDKYEVYLVMKDGCEDEIPTMDNIRGICVLNIYGSRFLLYPKYPCLPLLSEYKIKEYKGKCYNEAEALFINDNHQETSDLLALGSEAAKFVRQFGMDLPSLSMCISIEYYKDKINEIAKNIKDADLLINSDRWSSSRYDTNNAWSYGGRITDINHFCSSFMVSAVSAYS